MKKFFSKSKSMLVAPLLLASAFQYASAQRVFDEFDAPQIVEGKLYVDYGTTPQTLRDRYLPPYIVGLQYQALGTTGTNLVPADKNDGYIALRLPFTIQYAGNTYPANTDIQVSVNGFVAMTAFPPSDPGKNPNELFSGGNITNVVAPYWGDHVYRDAGGGFVQSRIAFSVTGQAPKRKLTIEWSNLNVNVKNAPNDPTSVANFQVSFYERDVPGDVSNNPANFNKQPDIEFAYGGFGGNGNIDPNYLNGASVGLKGSVSGQYINALKYASPAQSTSSTDLTSFWPVSGTSDRTIRMESYQRSLAINPDFFTSRFVIGSDRDDGYYRINLGNLNFDYTFQGVKQTNLWINVNGFVTFSDPEVFTPLVNNDPTALFINSSSYPYNVIAPFWGDHIYRRSGEQATPSSAGFFLGSEISYVVVGSFPNRRLVIQWKNLNVMDKTLPNSVANFQAILYEGQESRFPTNFAGGVEFAYGDVGNNVNTTNRFINVKGASVGMKGNLGGLTPPNADYINGLAYSNIATSFTSRLLTDAWRPSGGASSAEGRRIFFRAIPRFYTPAWGDGDADLSQLRTRKHAGLQQNRFVTVNDARLVMRWIVNDVAIPDSLKEDSLQYGNMYHADVNHNGRFYYSSRTFDNLRDTAVWRRPIDVDTFGTRVRWDSVESLVGLPPDAGPLRLIYYQVTPLDAALILHYISGRVPSLPWIWDTIPQYGKVVNSQPQNISFGKIFINANGQKVVPVYATQKTNKPFAFSVTFNGEVIASELSNENSANIVSNSRNTVHFASPAIEDIQTPVAFVTIKSEDAIIAEKKIVNDRVLGREVLESNGEVVTGVKAYPNPFESDLAINVPAEFKGGVLTVADVTGKIVATINLNQDITTVAALNGQPAGVYTLTLKNGVNVTNTVVVKR
jgi:hypothetical protein